MLAGQVTMERPEEMVVTLAPYRCSKAWQVKIDWWIMLKRYNLVWPCYCDVQK